jgi:hypothetical protein
MGRADPFRKPLASLCRRTSQSRAAFRGDEIEDRVFIEHQEGGAAFEGGGSEHQRRAEGTVARYLAQHLADVVALETVHLHRAVAGHQGDDHGVGEAVPQAFAEEAVVRFRDEFVRIGEGCVGHWSVLL